MTDNDVRELHGVRVLVCAQMGPLLASERDANDFLSAAWEVDATMVAIPVVRLGSDFLRLDTRIAGGVLQKFVNYGLRLAIVGDISERMSESRALQDFVSESNRGKATWFIADLAELERRLAPSA